MNQYQTAELALLVSAHSADLIEGTFQIPDRLLQRYWTSCRRRLYGWMRVLQQLPEDSSAATGAERARLWLRNRPILEDVFVSEILTRVWTAILTAADRRRRIIHAEPIARSTFLGHLEARHLALSQMVNSPDVSQKELTEIDRIRRRTERWTDLLLGHLTKDNDIAEFAFDPSRALDFGNEQLAASPEVSHRVVWNVLLASLRLSFPKTSIRYAFSIQIQRTIVSSVLGCFPADAFQGDGLLKSISVLRIARSGLYLEGPPLRQTTAQSRCGTVRMAHGG